MFNNIKMLLDITDTLSDNKINYHIDSVTKKILKYCEITELPIELEDVVVQIVIKRMDEDSNNTVVETVKLPIYSETKTKTPILDELLPHKVLLNSFRKVCFR